MLNDLEKRDAFLDENQDQVLDGLYSAYDVELNEKSTSNSPSFIVISLFVLSLIFALLFYLFEPELFQLLTKINVDEIIENTKSNVRESELVTDTEEPIQAELEEVNPISTSITSEPKLSVDKVEENIKYNHLLKLDDSLIFHDNINPSNITTVNHIDSIQFEVDNSGINLLMKTPDEIDYLVYGLSNPDRTVIEVENVELNFRLEDLVPVEPIVAIRYSINESKRFKLVLESDKPLTIKKSISSQSGDIHDLVVMMEYQWQKNETVVKEDVELAKIVEKQVELEKDTVFKGDLIKTLVNENSDAYAEQLFQQAYVAYQKGNTSESLKKLNMSLNQDAGHVKARSTLALVLSEKDHFELAYSVLNEGLIQFPDNVEWIKMYARLLLNEGKVVKARSLLAKHKPDLVSNTEYYALQAAILQKLNEHEEAAKIYRDLLKVNPSKGVWWMGLGISLESLKRYNDAIYAYQKASNNSAIARDSRKFISQRINRLNTILEDEST
jgi:thioredoxin-like negative regulator of GroEL